jgi:serine/threonine-protein kinase
MPKFNLFVFVFFLFVMSSCTQNETVDAPIEWVQHEATNYSINYPDNWELSQPGHPGPEFILFSELTSTDDNFKENINLLTQDLTNQPVDLDRFVEISEEQAVTLVPDGNILLSERKKANGLEFHRMIYTGTTGGFQLKFEQYFWVEGNSAYVLTFTAEEDQAEIFESIVNEIFKTFKLDI